MKIDPKTGRIAYHSLVFAENGGLDMVQYDFDGSVEYRTPYSRPEPFVHKYSFWERLSLAP